MDTETGGNAFLDRAYALGGAEEARALYDEWAETFDAELTGDGQGYVGHDRVAETVARVAGVGGSILDAGAGTGLVGCALRDRGATTIDGVDVSPGMLARAAATGAYRHLTAMDLTRPVPIDDATYDTVVSAGTFTHGHVGPDALTELVRVLRPGGVLVATVLEDLWDADGYPAAVDALAGRGLADLVSAEPTEYRTTWSVRARMLVLRRR